MSTTLLHAILLGVVEGITEFIPVSSTGHLLLFEHLLAIPRDSFLRTDFFNVVIQSFAMAAALPLFHRRVGSFFRPRDREARNYLAKLAVAFAITVAGGLLVRKVFHLRLPEAPGPVAAALVVGGILFVLVEKLLRGRKTDDVTWTVVVAVGVAQVLAAIFPGSSRSGLTILIALILGLGRPAATEFSFLVGIPTIFAASALVLKEGCLAVVDGVETPVPIEWMPMATASVLAAATSVVAVAWLLRCVRTRSFVGFGIYRIAAGLAVGAMLLNGH